MEMMVRKCYEVEEEEREKGNLQATHRSKGVQLNDFFCNNLVLLLEGKQNS